jgi:hypothetical protein
MFHLSKVSTPTRTTPRDSITILHPEERTPTCHACCTSPPPFLVYCLETQRTPFELHEFAANFATRDGSDVTVSLCTLLMDWCLVAMQTTKASTPTTSMLAISPTMAPLDDDAFLRWLYKIDRTRVDVTNMQAHALTYPLPPPAHAAQAATGPPPADVWKQMAKSLSTSFASAAAAMKSSTVDDADTSYELGGRLYDKFQCWNASRWIYPEHPIAPTTDRPGTLPTTQSRYTSEPNGESEENH